jgi:hypothetical protein
MVNPEFTVALALAEQESAADAAGDAVLPADDGAINQVRAEGSEGQEVKGK